MKCDYEALGDYLNRLTTIFSSISDAMAEIESSYQNVLSNQNWNSITRDFYYQEWQSMLENMYIINSKFANIKEYLETVIDNYSRFDKTLVSGFSKTLRS